MPVLPRSRLVAGVFAFAALVACSVASAGFYPARPVYDYEKYEGTGADCSDPSSVAADHGRCGPVDGPVFNSFINTPSYGDERAFFDGRPSEQTASGSYADNVDLSRSESGEAVLRIYINNDANEAYGPRTTASGTRVRVALPSGAAQVLRARAYISADNAVPNVIEDTADLLSDDVFKLVYVEGSATLYRGDDQYPLGSEIISEQGVLVGGTADMNGVYPAGFETASVVELRVRALPFGEENNLSLALVIGLVVGALTVFALLVLVVLPRRKAAVQAVRGTMTPTMWETVVAGLIVAAVTALVGLLLR